MSKRSYVEKSGQPTSNSWGSGRRVRSVILSVGVFVLLMLAGALPTWALGESMGRVAGAGEGVAVLGAFTWVESTVASIATVLSAWAAASVLLWAAGRLRWVTRHRQNRLARALQVALGGLLLMAVLLPYLIEHHPVLALLIPLTGILMTLAAGMRSANLADQKPSL